MRSADKAGASPGDLITYSIVFFNAGVDSVQNLAILDPISPWVEVEPGAFGAGLDLSWQEGAAPRYRPLEISIDAEGRLHLRTR